ncbi:Outer membrane efflux protein BepC precursor [Phocoenobacter uteri]|uniref:Outer membrane efflux protein BepC n=1 Tax=Phocoenobacter uteri TaxID=146806 RepID=A0A379CAQ9_9PAST|nr:TolC family protein [Phocoenobacter uteri]MDG6882604.1 hypothetical protein [Phocoenobacter uteri]SUB58767.1 Outer membrane efflux protein BepC precursor [Phocoenobacter uteri]
MQRFFQLNNCTKAMAIASFMMLANVSVSQAKDLRNILQYALNNDPILLEADADLQAAENRVGQAESLHLPTIRVVGNSLVTERTKEESHKTKNKFSPEVQMKLNLYSFGAIDAEIKKNKASKDYYTNKYNVSKEELGYKIGELYLNALNAKQAILVLQKSLTRHKAFLNEVRSIARYDEGRQSEVVQAEARKILVEQKINDQTRLLETTLKTLSKYYVKPITVKDLSDPFVKMTQKKLVSEYSLKDFSANPTYLAQQAELESKRHELAAEKAKQLPSINLVGMADREDQKLMVQFSWDIFDRATSYSIKEKENLTSAAGIRLDRVNRDVEEEARLAMINIERSRLQLDILKRQISANNKVANFYKSQFRVARRSLLDVLNAETELSDVELAYINTQRDHSKAILDYLHSQGKIVSWVK